MAKGLFQKASHRNILCGEVGAQAPQTEPAVAGGGARILACPAVLVLRPALGP